MKSGIKLSFLCLAFFGLKVWAESERFEIGGSARVRTEFKSNADFNDSTGDYTDFTGSRFRLDLKAKVTEKVGIFFQPQFSKTWGEPEYVPSSGTANTSTNTSGATNDTGLDVHQAHLSYVYNEDFSFLIGRKELNYGDELLAGGVGWSNVGRSFDLLQGHYKHAYGSVEAFSSEVVDRNVSSAGAGDRSFSGLYSANRLSDIVQNADAYVFFLDDGSTNSSTAAYGLRLKSAVEAFDYRFEATIENVKTTESTGERQYDLELGYTFRQESKSRVAVEYFSASENFDQLFPTGHKWLGYADLFSRRNIQGYRARISSQWWEKLTTSLDYHRFERQATGRSAYKFNGTAYGTVGSSSAVADEFDLVASYPIDESLMLEGGAAHVLPGDYLKANGGPDTATFYYLQVSSNF